MTLSAALLPEFDHEMANTRKTLERVPEDKFGWKPHEKSTSLGKLAGHLAQLPNLAKFIVGQDSLDVTSRLGGPLEPSSREQVLQEFDKSTDMARAAIAGASDQNLLQSWTLRAGEKVIFTLPRIGALRAMVMNHMIHHRAQLGVYLRLNDVPVPATYGPSADESAF